MMNYHERLALQGIPKETTELDVDWDEVVGMSLSLCVRAIIEGHVKIENVVGIIAGTACYTQEDWEIVFKGYAQSYWSMNPEEGIRIARFFVSHEMVVQPRIEGKPAPDLAHGGIWRKL